MMEHIDEQHARLSSEIVRLLDGQTDLLPFQEWLQKKALMSLCVCDDATGAC